MIVVTCEVAIEVDVVKVVAVTVGSDVVWYTDRVEVLYLQLDMRVESKMIA